MGTPVLAATSILTRSGQWIALALCFVCFVEGQPLLALVSAGVSLLLKIVADVTDDRVDEYLDDDDFD